MDVYVRTRYIAKPSSPRNSLKSDPGFVHFVNGAKMIKFGQKMKDTVPTIGFPMLIKSFIDSRQLKENI